MDYRLLSEFRRVFEGKKYRHRSSTQGDLVALHLFEDLYSLGRSKKLVQAIEMGQRVVNRQNKSQGIKARRGDAIFGEIIPGQTPISEKGFTVRRGPLATIEIGSEVKVLAKAMIKQIDRVIGDLRKQVLEFRRGAGKRPICVAVVGVNSAPYTIGYEGRRSFKTTGTGKYRNPFQESHEAEARLLREAAPEFDQFILLRYRATNDPKGIPPFPFEWVDHDETVRDYATCLTRISIEYDERF
jgi:hypothetical protein